MGDRTEALQKALETFHWLAHPHGCDETKCSGMRALALPTEGASEAWGRIEGLVRYTAGIEHGPCIDAEAAYAALTFGEE